MELFNESLTNRYNTLEGNIKSKSNSFYDSYLDLLEATIKYFLEENNIPYDTTRTCGHIVRNEKEVVSFLKNILKIDDFIIDKIPDYIKKCNDHKHKKEKCLSIESVVNYLKVYFDLVNYYIDYIKGIRLNYDANYYNEIFGETERLNNEYKLEVAKLKEELQESIDNNKLSEQDLLLYKSLVSEKNIAINNLDEQNKILQSQIIILKDIKLNSMEEKLNKTLELLMNLGESVVENRAVSIAIGESIIGADITKTEYMDKAKKTIEERNQNLFKKIDANATELARLSGKFSKVELDELIKLADRTLKANDIEGAQKLYNQVLLLDPKNWRAEFYVTCLNLYGSRFHSDFALALKYRDKLYENTICNILNMDKDDNTKKENFKEAFNLMEHDLNNSINCLTYQYNEYQKYLNDIQERYKKNLKLLKGLAVKEPPLEDKYADSYYGIELAIFTLFKSIEKIPYQDFKDKNKKYAEIFIDYVNNLKLDICKEISEEDLNKIIYLSGKSINHEYSITEFDSGRKG